MEKYKVYISKSKQSDFNELLKLKSDLARFDNIEVLEFQGGVYTPDLLLSADAVIFLPPRNSSLNVDDHNDDFCQIEIGRGQFEEYERIKNQKNCYLAYCGDEHFTIHGFRKHNESNSTYQNYGFLISDDNQLSLYDILDELCDPLDELFDSIESTPEQTCNSTTNLICEHNEPKIINDKKKLLISYGRSNS